MEYTEEFKKKVELAYMDREVPRVLEDLIDLLIAKNAIKLEDLPQAAQDKIQAKKQKRSEL
jgi:hypothetical protein